MDKIDYVRRKQLNDIASQFKDIYLNQLILIYVHNYI